MPGNGVGDRIHNFFAQENLPQGLRSQDGNWPLNDNLWVASQKQFGVSDSSPRNYNPQQSESERGHGGQRVSDQHIFNVTQTNTSSNGYMYGRQNFQTRPEKANFMGVNTEYGQNNVNQRGSLFYESQQEHVSEQPSKNPFRSEFSEAHGGFDLFGGQHQTNNSQHPGLLQQQSGFGDIQQLQQHQLMRRKMQELQRQQNAINQASQFSRQQNTINQASQYARQQVPGSLSHGLVNGTTTSDSSGYGCTDPAVVNLNWLHHASPVSQQVEPSLHGVSVSSSRGPINQFPQNNSYPGNNYAAIPEQHMVPNEGLFGNTFGQGSNNKVKMESDVVMVQDKSATDAAPLDPEEEKILFGSDDNIWQAFGSSKNMTGTGGVSSLLDDNEFASSLPSMQSGSWSALMQSAVAETTSTSGGDVRAQEWPEMPPGNHSCVGVQQTDINSGFNMTENDNSLQQSQNNDGKRVKTAAILHSSNLPNNHHFNSWKHVDSSMKSKGSESLEITQRRLTNKGPQLSESSFNNSSDKEDLRKENSNDSYRSSSSHLPDTVGQRERLSSEAGDSRSLAGRRISGSGPRKFQYHPMGNLDEDVGVPFGTRQGTNTAPVSLQKHHPMGNFGLPKSSGQGFVPDSGVLKGSDDTCFKGMVPGHLPNIFAPHDRSVGLSASDSASQPSQSQNMLELLHKVDQSRDGGIARRLNSLEGDLSSGIPEPENSDGSLDGHQRSHSSNSRGIGLQLGPPSQRLSMAVKHNNLRGKGHAELSSFPRFQETPCGEFKNNRMIRSGLSESQTMMTNLSPALGGTEFRNSRNDLQNHPTAANESFDCATSGVSQQGAFPKMLLKSSSKLPSQQASQQNLEQQEAEKRGNKSSLNAQGIITSVGQQSTEKVDQGQMMSQRAEGNDSSTASQKDLEAFGRSLKPTNFHQQISLLNQMKAYKHTYNNPNNCVSKRLNDSDNILLGQQVTVPPGNSEMPRSRLPSDNVDRSLASLPVNPPSKDALASDQSGPTSVKIENSHISPQMAPSWFDRYGTFKSGQISSQISDAARTMEQSFKVSGSLETPVHDSKEPLSQAAVDTSQHGVLNKTLVPSSGHQLTSQMLQPSITVQNLVTVRPKRRKWSRREIHSWLKEVSGTSKNLQGIWTASMEWCEATKRLMEKVEDDGELIEDVPRPKRRVILATHIMQQLFPPPPAFLSTKATSNYESVAFYGARLALGDACNLVSCVYHREPNILSDNGRASEQINVCLSKAVEECMSKAKRLESDFSRLDKSASILDLRMECQDLEKFSIINRFAKFHGRGQADSEASSLSDAAADGPKPFPQRYVIAVQLPKNLPERVQCLSL